MVKRKLKKLLALALSILMISSNFTELIPHAQAAETAPASTTSGVKDQFRHQDNGRPNLFVDFLGDNNRYRADGGPATAALNTLVAPGGYDQSIDTNPTGPGNAWGRYVNGDVTSATAGTIFWVGVGIDRKEVFKLLEGGEGLTSFEGGFYYDSAVVEPYIDPKYAGQDDAYLQTIADANIGSRNSYPANTQWNDNYEILRAETDLKPATDLITQEELGSPATLDDIMKEDGSWKMTYVSLELKDIATPAAQRRLGGNVYTGPTTDGDGNVVTPASARGDGLSKGQSQEDSDYQYLLLVPFRLKTFGGERRLHLRLLRNATHFSMGAGQYGVDPYGAWERVTTRNPGKDLKLLTRFTGDLYLFGTEPKADEVEYDALLTIINGGSTENTAKLIVDGDPAIWPVWADTDGDYIRGLQSGIGMRLDVHAQIGYTATVRVTYERYISGTTTLETVSHDFVTNQVNDQDSYYTFVMPEFKPVGTVTVTVVFQHETGDTFRVYLNDIPQPGAADYKTGNETTITTNLDANYDPTADTNTINTFDPVVPHPNTSHAGIFHADGPVGEARQDEGVRIHVETHADYEAVVRIYSFLDRAYTLNYNDLAVTAPVYSMDTNPYQGTDAQGKPIPNPHYGEITLPSGGDITFEMAATDIDVQVTYQKAKRYKATLEVYHAAPDTPVLDTNVAQLAYLAYDDGNVPSTAYSGVVYENYDDTVTPMVDDHRAVKDPTRKLPWVSRSAASLSGSLGGDTDRVGKVWNPSDPSINLDPETGATTVMALLASAPDLATFQVQINGLDLSTTVVTKDAGGNATLTGLRKNLYGDLYSDADVNDLAAILWELRERVEASTSLTATYKKSVQRSATDTTVAYYYYDFTAAQVQDYLLSIFNNEKANNANQSGYRTVRRAYLTAKRLYDELEPQAAYTGVLLAPIAPVEPRTVNVNASFEREYEDAFYESIYLHSYNIYIKAYQDYVEAAKEYGSPTHASVPQVPAADINNVQKPLATVTVPINSPTTAAANVEAMTTDKKWEQSMIKPDATPDEDEDPKVPAHTIYTREGRTVWVALEADSAYTVQGVELYHQNADGSVGSSIPVSVTPAPVQATGYQNVYSFTMPEEDCVVRVTYALRDTRKLNITVTGADGMKDNVSVVEAYRVAENPRDTKPLLERRTNEGHLSTDPYTPDPIEKVFVESTVTIRVKVDEDYNVELLAVNRNNATNIQIDGPTDNRDGTYTFVIPKNVTGDVDLSIAYSPKEQPKNWAEINAITPDDVTGDARNTAFWRETGLHHRLTDVAQGTLLTGEITVAPGYYIYSVTAYGDSGNYPYTLTGNGYNGGYGTMLTGTSVPINVFVTMPGENLTVDVVFRQGIPDPTPANTLTLTVKDDDNDDPDPAQAAPNWARATVYDDPADLANAIAGEQTLPTVGALPGDAVGKNVDYGNGTLSDRKYVETGKWVKVDFHNHVVKKADGTIDTANSYYVSKVTVGPSNLGVSMVWESDHSVSFYMPAGSAGVTVEFSKYPENGRLPTYFLTVRETYTDLNAGTIDQADYNNNYVTFADSTTIQSWNHNPIQLFPYDKATGNYNPERLPNTANAGATGVAEAGEEITMTFVTDEPGWYVQSVVVISDGAAYRGSYTDVTPAGATGTRKTYQAKFRMPTGDAEFIVHYRRGPKPTTPDYAFTLTLTDDDNVLTGGVYDDNHITASFSNAAGQNVANHIPLTVGRTPTADPAHTTEGMMGVRHIHAGDTVTLKTTIAPGYTLDYMLVNPTGLKIYPIWQDANTATFTMPSQGVAVVARVVKGDPQHYTANLILHPPAGMTSMDGVGQGTFVLDSGGSLNGYPQNAVFSTYAVPGTTIPYDLYAFDGYYIDRVTVDPDLGAVGTLSGAFGYQNGEFTMPAANVNVNVWFKKGWPDEATYRLTLEVFDSSLQLDGAGKPQAANNNASFTQVAHTDGGTTTVFAAPDNDKVYGGQRKHLRPEEGVAFDRDTVYVAVHTEPGSYMDSSCVNITDTAGNTISWWYAPGGIAFTMPPRAATVRITFRQGTPPQRKAWLHIWGDDGADAAVLSADSAAATPGSVNTDGGEISNLVTGDTLRLNVTPDPDRHVTAAYAVDRATGKLLELTHDLAYVDLVYSGGAAEFAMPEGDVDVYVRFAKGTIQEGELPLKLMVSGAPGSGSARTEVTAPGASTTKTDINVSAPGMDTRFVEEGDKVLTTFSPKTDDGYAISKLEVYDTDGNPVPYEWISVIQVPPTLTDPDMWLGTAPGSVATHPTWEQNPELQITFSMPGKGVTIHVTYDKVDQSKEYVAQVVVNDSAYSDQPAPSQNNAWLRNEAVDSIQRKLQYAHPGQWIDLDITVHPGYRIEFIKVVPQSFGIVPGLPLGVYDSQNTGFVMPAGNVTVYVKFADDGLEERNATLVVTGAPTGDAANYGVIASPRSGVSDHVLVNGAPQVVTARPVMDWVTTDYYWNTNGSAYIKRVSVTTTSGVAVPFTQLEDPTTGHGTITFPMVNENVTVRVEYSTDKPEGEEIYLHVIDATTGTETLIGTSASALLRYPTTTVPDDWQMTAVNPLRRDAANPWGNTVGAYHAPAGQKVRLTTNALTAMGVYLQSAYVLYEDIGQMLDLKSVSATATTMNQDFIVHPGRNDVYVTFTREQPDPDEHAAILMLKAPENNAGRASIAVNDVYDGPNVEDQDHLNEANVGHARVIAKQGNRIIIQVAPAEGYIIDSVLVTPLGFPLQTQAVYNYTQVGNTISFDMPHRDIAITVTLKRGTNQHYAARLHYIKDTAPVQLLNYAKLDWVDEGVSYTLQADLMDSDPDVWEDVQKQDIREGTAVTLTGHLGGAPADPDKPDTILSAFVLRADGTLVTLAPSLEGEKADNGTAKDYPASFIMPADDVDIYLVVTTEPPVDPWHTVVLVATDTSPSATNSGDNLGYLWKDNDTANRKTAVSTGNPGCVWMPVEEGKTFAVRPEAHAGYAFVPPATLSCNDGAHGGNMYAESTSPYVYRDTMGTCNKAALVTFVSDEALKLTVIIRDPENPSDGSTTNKLLTRQPTATPNPVADLNLISNNVGGAYQIMEGVTPGEPILLTATPQPGSGFTATAQIYYYDGTVDDIPLTKQADGTYTGSIPMPPNNATIIVTFHGDYTGTLTLYDLSKTDKTAQATMFEDSGTAPDRITVNHLGTSDSLTHLFNGTTLTANMLKNDNLSSKTVTVLLNRGGSTTLMSPSGQNAEGVDEYTHTINRADAEMVFVVRDKTDPTYVAAVRTINKPAFDLNGDAVAYPTIQATPAGAAFGDIWTTADAGSAVTVTLDVPDGYEARLSVNNGVTLSVPGPIGPVTGQQTSFTMPAADTLVTVEYVKTEFELTLRIIKPSGTAETTRVDTTDYTGSPDYLTVDGYSTWVKANTPVTLTDATPGAGLYFRSASYASDNGAAGFLVKGDTFPMPAGDTVVTVRYSDIDPDNPPPDQPTRYIALVEIVGDGNPGNKATDLANTTTSGLSGASPYWVEGVTGDAIRAAYQIEPGYVARVSAYRRGNLAAQLPVANVASSSNGSATVTMPGNTDVVIRIEYIKTDEEPDGDVILQLVAHGDQAGNSANVTSPIANTLNPATILMDGANTPGNGIPVTNWNWANAIETPKVSTSTMGDELRVYANWATNYQVVKMTVAVRRADNTETPEVPITVSRYGSAAAGRTLMPYVDQAAGEAAVVRVYYGNIFEATLHVVRNGTTGDETHATDNRGINTVTSTGSKPIYNTGDKLLDFMGDNGEIVETTAIPDTANNQRLVGVVWESPSTGAADAAANATVSGQYDFEMPADNVDFYAVYETEPDDPKDRSYIAKVRFDGTAHLGDSQNAVTITNTSDASAAHGSYWTAAKHDEVIVVNVKVAPGYKAEIIRTYEDDSLTHTPPYDFYINRVGFVPNLTLGRDATFTMPADTDATVYVRFTKGYDLSLEVQDTSPLATPASKNAADVTTGETPARTLHGESNGTTTVDSDGPLQAVDGGVNISTNVTAATDGTDTAKYKVYRTSPFTGTVRVNTPTAVNPYSYAMPSADTVETVLFYNEDTPLLAKVELKGESDINGNAATPIIDRTDTTSPDGGVTPPENKTVTGTVWTTTDGTHWIDLKLTVAKGYVAKIRVRRDNDNYYNNLNDETKWDWLDAKDFEFQQGVYTLDDSQTPAADVYKETAFTDTAGVTEVTMGFQERVPHALFPNDIGGEEHFVFKMPEHDADGGPATDVTVIVEFVFAGTIPQPFDPDNMKMDHIDLDRGFVYGENRSDFALIDIPTLYQDTDKTLFDTDNYDKPAGSAAEDPQKNVKFNFFLYNAAKDEYTPLVAGVDVLLEPEDEDTLKNTGDPYNYYDYQTKRAAANDVLDDNMAANPEKTYVGSRFKLIPTEPDKTTKKRTAGAQALYEMLNNKGSLEKYAKDGADAYRTTLYVIAEDAIGQKSAYTQVWIRPHFTVEVAVISYAPNHTTTASLYPWMTQDELDEASGFADGSSPTQELRDARVFEHYRWDSGVKPYLSNYTHYDGEVLGANKYYQKVGVMSSELLGGYDASYDPGAATLLKNVLPGAEARYALTLEKASDLTYTRVDLDLLPDVAYGFDLNAMTFPSYYDDTTLTYSISDIVYLITGDVDGNGYTKWQDYDTVYTYVWRNVPWNNTQTEAPDPSDPNYAALQTAWLMSTHNPDSMAYRCDLNGDGVLSFLDVQLVQTVFDYNRSEKDYWWTHQITGEVVLPFGFGGEKGNYAALFALEPEEDVFPVEPDEYWSQLVDPETTDAPPLNMFYVDDDGTLWRSPIPLDYEDPAVAGQPDPDEDDAVKEIPRGDEVTDRPVYIPDAGAELPWSDPDDEPEDVPIDLPPDEPDLPIPDDNGPGEEQSETSADITTEE